jgi:hypothetical protein
MEKEHQPDDTVLRMDGMEFLLDSDSAPFLEEATIDYVEEFGGRVGFVINNPMYAGGGCGCGSRRRRMWLRRTLGLRNLRQSRAAPGAADNPSQKPRRYRLPGLLHTGPPNAHTGSAGG